MTSGVSSHGCPCGVAGSVCGGGEGNRTTPQTVPTDERPHTRACVQFPVYNKTEVSHEESHVESQDQSKDAGPNQSNASHGGDEEQGIPAGGYDQDEWLDGARSEPDAHEDRAGDGQIAQALRG